MRSGSCRANPGPGSGRLKETLEIVEALWAGETLDYHGEYFTLRAARTSNPGPSTKIPITIGGAGPPDARVGGRPRRLVERPHRHRRPARRDATLRRLGPLLPAGAGGLRARTGHPCARSPRRHGAASGRRPSSGALPNWSTYFGALTQRGVERVYAWFCDFAAPETLLAFGEDVIGAFAAARGSRPGARGDRCSGRPGLGSSRRSGGRARTLATTSSLEAPGPRTAATPAARSTWHVVGRDDAANHDRRLEPGRPQRLDDGGSDRQVGPVVHGDAHDVDVLLARSWRRWSQETGATRRRPPRSRRHAECGPPPAARGRGRRGRPWP